MRKFYLIGAILVFLLILVLSFSQVGASCSWYLISPTSPAFLVLLQTSGLGAVMGGLLILFWKAPVKASRESDDESPSEIE